MGVFVALLAGYLLFDRAFAHLHIPGTPIYPAELVLAVGLALVAAEVAGLLRLSTPLRALAAFATWGGALLFFSVFEHGLDAVQDSAIWYYGLFAIVAAALLRSTPDVLERLIPIYALGLAGFAVLGWVRLAGWESEDAARLPDTLVPWTSHRPGNIAVHAAIGFAKEGELLGDLCAAVEETILPFGFTVVREYVGHGVHFSLLKMGS